MILYRPVTFIELMLYHICVLVLSVRLIGAGYDKRSVIVSFPALFIPILVIELCTNDTAALIINYVFPFIELPVLCLCLRGISIRTLAIEYLFLVMIGVILVSANIIDLPKNYELELIIELVVTILTTTIVMLICFSSLRTKIRYALRTTPHYAKIIIMILLLCCTFLSVSILNEKFDNRSLWVISVKLCFLILIVAMFVVILILIHSFATNKHFKGISKHYERQIKAQTEYYARMSDTIFSIRKFRHDHSNLCIGLEKLITEGKTEEALKMLNAEKQELEQYKTLFDTGNAIADAILTDKTVSAEKAGACISFEGGLPADGIDPADLCLVFGNTLDNAAEACQTVAGDKAKLISVRCSHVCGFVFIDISNPVSERVRINGGMPVTTKRDRELHGFGLYSLGLVVEKYHGEVKYSCTDNEFSVSISLQAECRETQR